MTMVQLVGSLLAPIVGIGWRMVWLTRSDRHSSLWRDDWIESVIVMIVFTIVSLGAIMFGGD